MFKVGDIVYLTNLDSLKNDNGLSIENYFDNQKSGMKDYPRLILNAKCKVTHVFKDDDTCGVEYYKGENIEAVFDCRRFSISSPDLSMTIPSRSSIKKIIKELRSLL